MVNWPPTTAFEPSGERTIDRRQELLGRYGAVPGDRRFEAGVAVAAGRRGLAEVAEQVDPAAVDRFAQGQHRVEVGAEVALVREVARRLGDHAPLLDDVLQSVGEPGDGRLAVTPCATGLLVVALDALGEVDMGDEPDVGLVDPHAEGDGRDDHDAVLAEEARLRRGAHGGVEPGVVRHGVHPVVAQELRRLLHRLPTEAVDDRSAWSWWPVSACCS